MDFYLSYVNLKENINTKTFVDLILNKNIVIIFSVVIASLVGISIFFSSDIYQSTFQNESVKITMHKWPGYAHSYIAQEKGFFEDEGVNVELVIIENIDDSLQYFKAGKADAAFGLQSDAMLLYAKGIPLKIVYIADFSNGGDVIVSKLDIKTIMDLKGKTVSIDKLNSFNHIFLIELLKINGLEESDVKIVPIIASLVPDALKSGLIDAGQTWEPYQSHAIANGYRLLATSADAPGIITDVLMFHSKFIEERPEDVKKVLRGLSRALEFRDTNQNESYHIMSNAFEMSPSSLKVTIEGNIFPNLKENNEAFMDSGQPTSLYTSGKIISDFFIDKGVFGESINIDHILATEIVSEIILE